jgi:hypothetical protein
MSNPRLFDLAVVLREEIPTKLMNPDDVGKLTTFADSIAALFQECVKRGGYTTSAEQFFERYSWGTDRQRYIELFGQSPPF